MQQQQVDTPESEFPLMLTLSSQTTLEQVAAVGNSNVSSLTPKAAPQYGKWELNRTPGPKQAKPRWYLRNLCCLLLFCISHCPGSVGFRRELSPVCEATLAPKWEQSLGNNFLQFSLINNLVKEKDPRKQNTQTTKHTAHHKQCK